MKKELENLLSQHEEFLIEDVLNKNNLSELARKYDAKLLNVLMKEDKIKNHFFVEVEEGVSVFKKDVFLQFLNNKEFLPDSFTAYKTKIGLGRRDGSLLSESRDIVLNFPYKDCILEGGQTKEDTKRSEVFFNETLAPTEITRLLDDKVFTNFKRYDKDGEHEVKEIKEDDNFIIKGNNLVVLHSLKKRYAGKVKCIYIDPPYNTGSDSFGYNDRFNHSTWLTFMKNRLVIAKELLCDDGVIFVQCDDNEQAYLKVLMDEIFGNHNFLNCIAVKMSEPSGIKMSHVGKRLPKLKEYILLYKKNTVKLNEMKIPKENWDDEYKTVIVNLTKEELDFIKKVCKNENRTSDEMLIVDQLLDKADYKSLTDIYKEENISRNIDKIKYNYENSFCIFQTVSMSGGTTNSISESMKKKKKNIFFSHLTSKNKLYIIKGNYDINKRKPRIQVLFADEYLNYNPGDFWMDIKTTGLDNEGAVSLKNGKKPEALIQRILELVTNEKDLVLDFHLGSGTTAAVAHKINRQYIGIEQMDYIENVSIERMKKVILGEQGGISKNVNWQGGGDFIYCELKNDAQDYKNKVIEAQTTEELLELLKIAKKSSFLSYRIDSKKLKEKEFLELSFAEQKKLLLEIVDNNNLYVNYTDIEDENYETSYCERILNDQFYK